MTSSYKIESQVIASSISEIHTGSGSMPKLATTPQKLGSFGPFPPLNPVVGNLWYSTNLGVLFVFTGNVWLSVHRSNIIMSRSHVTSNSYLYNDGTPSNLTPYLMPVQARILGIAVKSENTSNWIVDIQVNGSSVHTETVTGGILINNFLGLDVLQADEVSIYAIGSSISKPNVNLIYAQLY